MRAIVQRVCAARVEVGGETVSDVEHGLIVYFAAGKDDGPDQADWMADKVVGLRVFPDASDRMSLDVRDVAGAVLVVSQFTLYGDVRRGRRPSFDRAGAPERAEALYLRFCDQLRSLSIPVETGLFRAYMQVHAVVDGPVTILIDSDKAF